MKTSKSVGLAALSLCGVISNDAIVAPAQSDRCSWMNPQAQQSVVSGLEPLTKFAADIDNAKTAIDAAKLDTSLLTLTLGQSSAIDSAFKIKYLDELVAAINKVKSAASKKVNSAEAIAIPQIRTEFDSAVNALYAARHNNDTDAAAFLGAAKLVVEKFAAVWNAANVAANVAAQADPAAAAQAQLAALHDAAAYAISKLKPGVLDKCYAGVCGLRQKTSLKQAAGGLVSLVGACVAYNYPWLAPLPFLPAGYALSPILSCGLSCMSSRWTGSGVAGNPSEANYTWHTRVISLGAACSAVGWALTWLYPQSMLITPGTAIAMFSVGCASYGDEKDKLGLLLSNKNTLALTAVFCAALLGGYTYVPSPSYAAIKALEVWQWGVGAAALAVALAHAWYAPDSTKGRWGAAGFALLESCVVAGFSWHNNLDILAHMPTGVITSTTAVAQSVGLNKYPLAVQSILMYMPLLLFSNFPRSIVALAGVAATGTALGSGAKHLQDAALNSGGGTAPQSPVSGLSTWISAGTITATRLGIGAVVVIGGGFALYKAYLYFLPKSTAKTTATENALSQIQRLAPEVTPEPSKSSKDSSAMYKASCVVTILGALALIGGYMFEWALGIVPGVATVVGAIAAVATSAKE